ncbi:MAG: AI-2E family transporter [Thermodesulfovibrionales bacterium]
MTEQNHPDRGMRFLVIAAALVIIVWGINQAQSVPASFLVAVFLAVIGTPPVLWLERKRIPCESNKGTRWIAVLLRPEAPTESIPRVSKKV